jgi:hypothetical protein
VRFFGAIIITHLFGAHTRGKICSHTFGELI